MNGFRGRLGQRHGEAGEELRETEDREAAGADHTSKSSDEDFTEMLCGAVPPMWRRNGGVPFLHKASLFCSNQPSPPASQMVKSVEFILLFHQTVKCYFSIYVIPLPW